MRSARQSASASATARSSGDHAEAARLHKRAMDVATKKGDKKIADWHEKAWKGHVRAAHWTKKHEDCGMTLPDLADLRLEMLSVLAVDEGMAEEASEYIASALAKKKSQVREQETGSKYPREVKDASMLAHKASMDSKEPHAGPDTHARASNLHFIAHGIAKAHQFHDLADRHMQMAQKHRTLQKPAAVSNAG